MYSTAFTKNRAEELDDDLWGEFVKPENYEVINLSRFDKAVRVEGGRGSGKTMFLKYHCFPTRFSEKRGKIPADELDKIFVYWRPDTNFVRLINYEWLGDSWTSVFETYCGLCLILELSNLVKKLDCSNIGETGSPTRGIDFYIPEKLSKSIYGPELELRDASVHIENKLYELVEWLGLPLSEPPPIVISGLLGIRHVSKMLKRKSHGMSKSVIHFLIDEFENLSEPQQMLINTWIKHGDKDTLFSIAHKKHAFITKRCNSEESLANRNDYRQIDLEDSLFETSKSFEKFAADILIKRLADSYSVRFGKDLSFLGNPDGSYEKIKICEKIFPGASDKELANYIFEDEVLYKKLYKNIERTLVEKKSALKAESFIDPNFKAGSVVNSVVLRRERTKPEVLLKEFLEYKSNNSKSFDDKVDNSLVGSVLYYYMVFPKKPCPFYSGFHTYCVLSKNNIRHFLELVYQSFFFFEKDLSFSDDSYHVSNLSVPKGIQAKATKKSSFIELEKFSELGARGTDLKRLAVRLGKLFKLSQKRSTQSEPEVNHFSVNQSDLEFMDNEINDLLREAKVWNLIFEEPSTKNKKGEEVSTQEYILHPILSPCLGISYRKKRKLSFNSDEVSAIMVGNDEKFGFLVDKYKKKWSVDDDEKENGAEQIGLLL